MTTVLVVTAALLGLAGTLVLVRLLRGPSLQDRLVAVDTLLVLIACGIALNAVHLGELTEVVLLVVLTLVGFLSTLTVLRLASEKPR
jgi:multicomponent Na+:H+ antiporter subunit F